MSEPSATRPPQDVGDLMSTPLVTCGADVPVNEVAALMARHGIHAVVVRPDVWAAGDSGEWGVISDLDLMGAAAVDLDTSPPDASPRHRP